MGFALVMDPIRSRLAEKDFRPIENSLLAGTLTGIVYFRRGGACSSFPRILFAGVLVFIYYQALCF